MHSFILAALISVNGCCWGTASRSRPITLGLIGGLDGSDSLASARREPYAAYAATSRIRPT